MAIKKINFAILGKILSKDGSSPKTITDMVLKINEIVDHINKNEAAWEQLFASPGEKIDVIQAILDGSIEEIMGGGGAGGFGGVKNIGTRIPKKPLNRQTMWLIWSIEHNAWWAANSQGYVQDRASAGIYSYTDALYIVESANIGERDIPNEAMISLD